VEIQDVIGNAFDAAMVTRTYDVLRGDHRGNRHRAARRVQGDLTVSC
jgi:hypothetical protein